MDKLVKAGLPARDRSIGAAWLSSARVVRCWVKSRNERNPCPVLPYCKKWNSQETARDNLEEGGDDVKSSWPLCPGLHTCFFGWFFVLCFCVGVFFVFFCF